jgi:hypothetical protein
MAKDFLRTGSFSSLEPLFVLEHHDPFAKPDSLVTFFKFVYLVPKFILCQTASNSTSYLNKNSRSFSLKHVDIHVGWSESNRSFIVNFRQYRLSK